MATINDAQWLPFCVFSLLYWLNTDDGDEWKKKKFQSSRLRWIEETFQRYLHAPLSSILLFYGQMNGKLDNYNDVCIASTVKMDYRQVGLYFTHCLAFYLIDSFINFACNLPNESNTFFPIIFPSSHCAICYQIATRTNIKDMRTSRAFNVYSSIWCDYMITIHGMHVYHFHTLVNDMTVKNISQHKINGREKLNAGNMWLSKSFCLSLSTLCT